MTTCIMADTVISNIIQVAPSPESEEDVATEQRIQLAADALVYGNANGEVTLELNELSSTDQETLGELAVPLSNPQLSTPLDEQVIQDVLDTRPTLQLGRSMSMKYNRRNVVVPVKKRGSLLVIGHRKSELAQKSASLPGAIRGIDPASIFALEQEAGGEVEGKDIGFKEPALYRQSTRRLKERIIQHRESQKSLTIVARDSILDNFRYVKWPKLKSKLSVYRSWELWKGHMKVIEGHFGTAVVSYFIFLRFLFIMNLFIFALWFGFVVIPGIIFNSVNNAPHVESQAACTYPSTLASNSSSPIRLCPGDDPDSVSMLMGGETRYYRVVNRTCTVSVDSSFEIRSCDFGTSLTFNNTFDYVVAEKEGEDVITVYTDELLLMTCDIEELRVCSGVDPAVLWYEYIIHFVLGQGIFNDTILFYGRYGNDTISGSSYSMSFAYLMVTFAVYFISVVLLVIKLGSAYNESYTKIASRSKVNFSSKVFTAWDFNITHPSTANLKRSHIRREFEEVLSDFKKHQLKRTTSEWAVVISIRIFTNLFTIVVLVGAATTIYYAAEYSLENQSSTLEGLVLPVLITTLNLVLPFLFSFLALVERFKTQSGEIAMTLIRTIMVRMASLVVLVITLFILISCTQQVDDNRSTSTSTDTCTFTPQALTDIVNITSTSDCPVCWETFVGQEFYKLGLTNFVVSVASTIFSDTSRNMLSRIKFKDIGKKIGKGNFNIPKSILDLIYTQGLLWLGFFFSPMLPAVIMITSFVLFYVKRYDLVYNLIPSKRGAFRAARTNFLFIFLMLISLFVFIIPIAYVIAAFAPSTTCGPFRGNDRIHSIISVEDLPCIAQQIFDFIASIGFVIPFLVLLLLIIYGQYVVLRARKERFQLIKKQLVLEGANVTHIIGKLNGALRKVAEHRAQTSDNSIPFQHSNLRSRIQKLSIDQGDARPQV